MKIEEISDKKIWEQFITRYAPQSLFQSWNWGEVTRHEKSLWRLGVYDEEKLVGIAQVVKVSARRGTFLHVRHGPVFSSWDTHYLEAFFHYVRDLSKKEGACFVRVSPLIEQNKHNDALFRSYGFRDAPIHAIDAELCWVLDIDRSDEEILAGMRKTTRYLIRQAQKQGVVIRKSIDTKDLDDFFSLYETTAQRHHFVKHAGIVEEFALLRKDDQIVLFKGHYQNELVSAALIVFYNHQAIYHHSASIVQKAPVNYLLQWEAIQEAKRRGKKMYNFWGIAPEGKQNHPWMGLSLFKKGFGGTAIEYMHAKDLPVSPRYWVPYSVESFRKYMRGF